jgi:hypothetical protein
MGTPEGVNKELEAVGEGLSGQSKEEFLEAKPHLQGLINQIVGQNVKLTASGYATFANGKKTYGNMSVSLDSFYGKFCE